MATELIMYRKGSRLVPSNGHSEEMLDKFKQDVDLMAKVSVPRNIRTQGYFWALLSKVAKNHPEYNDARQVMREIKMRLGMLKPYIVVDHRTGKAKTIYEVESTSFDAMDQVEFQEFVARAKDVITTHILPGVSKDELNAEIAGMI